MNVIKISVMSSILILCSSCAELGIYFALRAADSSPAAWISGNQTQAISILIPPIYAIDGELRYAVCFELLEDLETSSKNRSRRYMKNGLETLNIHGPLADDGKYLYLLLPKDDLVSFFRKISLKWTKESALTDDIIEFKDFSTPIYIVTKEGIELQHNRGEYTPTTIFMSKTTGFRDIYQEEIHETPIAPPLHHIEQKFLEQQSEEMSKDEEQ